MHAEYLDLAGRLAEGMDALKKVKDSSPGVSPRDCVFEDGKLKLYRYSGRAESRNAVPLLIVYALVNRPYMADLQEGRSLIQGLLEAGIDVYLVDWGYPDKADAGTSLDDYVNTYMDECVDFICEKHDIKSINMLGICQGGAFSLCYTALHQEKIRNLITTVTPVDFHTKNDLLSHLVRHIDIDLCVDTFGNIPGDFLNGIFLSLKPYRLMGQKYIDFLEIMEDEDKLANFLCMEKWIFDCPDQAGQAFRDFVVQFYQQNGLVKSQVQIGGEMVDLENITIPVLNIYARDDHLVPPDASKALAGCVSSEDYSELEFPGGHIGIYVSSRSQTLLPPTIAEWLSQRS